MCGAAAVLTACASAPTVKTRSVEFHVTSDPSNQNVVIAGSGDNRHWFATATPITGTMDVWNEELTLALDLDQFRYVVKPSRQISVSSSADMVNVHFVVTDRLPLLQHEFRSYPVGLRQRIVDVVGAYEAALESPNFVVPQKISEAKAKLNQVLVEFPLVADDAIKGEFEWLHLYFGALSGELGMIGAPASPEIVRNATKAVEWLKAITGQY